MLAPSRSACWLLIALACGVVRGVADEQPAFTPAQLQLPEGFTVEVAAAPPLVQHPMLAGFDPQGRLYIAETAGLNLPRAELEKQLPNFVRRLEDTNGDGVFDRSTIFADKLTFPQGALWHRDALFVASSGGIWRFQDADDDGVAEIRQQIVSEFGYTGNAADVHGCFLGPTGRLYWCEGRHGHEFHDDGGHVLSAGKAARIFSCAADGSDVRVHCGGGMDNPVEIDFTETGEMLGTVNILYRQRGDCLVHWMYGGVYPRYDQPQVVAEFRRTGDLLPPVINLGHVAVSGTTRVRGDALGAAARDAFLVTEFNTHKVVRVNLQRSGATFEAAAADFLTSSSDDFHPTDVLQDADGSLLVIDTGGWFRIGCPTSQIAKPNILGAIYRIRRTGDADTASAAASDPRGQHIAWAKLSAEQLVGLLGDVRHVVQERAIEELVQHGPAALPALKSAAGSPEIVRRSVWALARIGSAEALAAIRPRLGDADNSVRQAAVHAVGLARDRAALPQLTALLKDAAPAIRREAATALGQLGDSAAVASLLATVHADDLDRVTEHAVIYALIEIHDRASTLPGLQDQRPVVSRAALIALDQMEQGGLSRELVVPLFQTTDLNLRTTLLDVVARHPEWAAEVVEPLRQQLAGGKIAADERQPLTNLMLAFVHDDQIRSLLAEVVANPAAGADARRVALEVMAEAGLQPLPEPWAAALEPVLKSGDATLLDPALRAIEGDSSTRFVALLRALVELEQLPARERTAALSLLGRHGGELHTAGVSFLARQVTSGATATERLAAAKALGGAVLTDDQRLLLAGLAAQLGPLELTYVLPAFETCSHPQVGGTLVAALESSPGLNSLSAERLAKTFQNFPAAVQSAATRLVAGGAATAADQAKRLAELESALAGGDPSRGQQVFFGQRTACSACHLVGATGGRVGPDLTTIGQRRNGRDLLEAVLYPSSSLARGFESFAIATTDGKTHVGMIVRETKELLTVRSTDQTELRLPHSQIESLTPSPVSIMPQGLERTMSEAELRDLVAYLLTLK